MTGTNEAFDRAARQRDRDRRRRPDGKEALFSTAPSSAPPPMLELHCPVCNVTAGLAGIGDWWDLVRPPFLLNPLRQTVWNRCPNCGERAWLEVRIGPALRALLGRPGS